MEEISSLAAKLKAHLSLHQARANFISQFILSLIQGRSTNLRRVAEEFQSKADTESTYRRIKRFFAHYEYSYQSLGLLILSCLDMERYTLCMDRTNWKHGSKHVNYLVISVAWQGAAVPIAWECLDKNGGNSNSCERITLMEHVLTMIPAEQIEHLLADREFVGRDWFAWLKQAGISCRLRIKSNVQVKHNGKLVSAGRLCRSTALNQTVTWYSKKEVSGVPLYLAAHRTTKGLLMVVATEDPGSMVADYYRRWGIEVMFGNLKSRGFDMESTHMTKPERMNKLMGLLALACTWCLAVGHWEYGEASELPLNKHYRPEKSLFRLGLDLLRRALKNKSAKNDHARFNELLAVLSPT